MVSLLLCDFDSILYYLYQGWIRWKTFPLHFKDTAQKLAQSYNRSFFQKHENKHLHFNILHEISRKRLISCKILKCKCLFRHINPGLKESHI